MEPTQEKLNAFIDGELPAAEMQEIETLLAQRPDLVAAVERQSALRRHLGNAFAPVMDEAIPQNLRDAVMSSPVSSRFRMAAWLRAAGTGFAGHNVFLRAAIPTAALAFGLLIGIAIQRDEPAPFRASSGGQMIAQGELADTLTNQLASAGTPQTGPRIGVSFRNHDGRDCRTFLVPGRSASTAGVACHEGRQWAVAALAAAPGETSGNYQQAGSEMPSVIRNTVSSMIAGEPFDAKAESSAHNGGWRGN